MLWLCAALLMARGDPCGAWTPPFGWLSGPEPVKLWDQWREGREDGVLAGHLMLIHGLIGDLVDTLIG